MGRTIYGVTMIVAGIVVAGALPARAQEKMGAQRVYLMDGRTVEGETQLLADGSYEVKTKYGITLTIPKGQVRRVTAVEEGRPDRSRRSPGEQELEGVLQRRPISDEEIEEILDGIEAVIVTIPGEVDLEDLRAELPVNEESVQEMVRLAGGPEKAKVREWPHFVLVYTSSDEAARKLGSRLESVWRWNEKFINRLGLSAQRPEHKLEIYYFGTYDEFYNYSLNEAIPLGGSELGYFKHDINRSQFFDLIEWPSLQYYRRMAENPRVPAQERRRIRNVIQSWVELHNQEVIQHEAGHHIHFNTGVFIQRGADGGTAPTWLVEGTTMMFEVPPSASGGGGAGLGELNDARLEEFRRLYPPWTAGALKSFILNNGEWYQGYNYPRGWAIVYYLWKQHRDGLGKYMRMIRDRPPGEEPSTTEREREFEECFGRLDDEWVERFYEFLGSMSVRPSRLPPRL